MPIITNIATYKDEYKGWKRGDFDFYKFTLDNGQYIEIAISGAQRCCEEFRIEKTGFDTMIYTTITIKEQQVDDDIEWGVLVFQFLNEQTMIGQVRVLNRHNGYYPHDVYYRDEKGTTEKYSI
jgi:hypothetical protein